MERTDEWFLRPRRSNRTNGSPALLLHSPAGNSGPLFPTGRAAVAWSAVPLPVMSSLAHLSHPVGESSPLGLELRRLLHHQPCSVGSEPTGRVLMGIFGRSVLATKRGGRVQSKRRLIAVRRGKLVRLASLDDLRWLELPEGVVFLDLDNTLLPYQPSVADVAQLPAKLEAAIDALLGRTTVVVTTNTRNHPAAVAAAVADAGLPFVACAGKPRSRRLVGVTGRRPVAVVGDQPVTDGMLAWRLGVPFLLVPGCSLHSPWWPRLMRLVGELILWLFYRSPGKAVGAA